MPPTDGDLLRALAVGPAFLLLGQASSLLHNGHDDVILSAAGRAGLEVGELQSKELLKLDSQLRGRVYELIAEASRSAATPPWLEQIARYPWNAVVTSRIDAGLYSAFGNEWRSVVPTAEIRGSRGARNASEMRLCHLYGGVALAEEDRPPLDELQRAMRTGLARRNLEELTESLLTPRGILVIEGYDSADWVSPELLFVALAGLRPGQAHLFSVYSVNDPFLSAAVERGQLVTHKESLASFLGEAEDTGRLHRPLESGAREHRLVRLGSEMVHVDRDTWNRIISTARPVDDTTWTPFPSVSAPLEYARFREFLGASQGAPAWTPIASGYNFPRDFEEELLRIVRQRLKDTAAQKPLILAGQTATGKSTALLALALTIAREGIAAVLHISKRGERPSVTALDEYALWAEEHGAQVTLVVWDGMTDPEEYFAAHRQLGARGRRVLIVGTSYVQPSQKHGVVEAPRDLTPSEVDRLPGWLAGYGIPVVRFQSQNHVDFSFLSALYRYLPDSRQAIKRGLNLEIRYAEAGIEQKARQNPDSASWASRLGIMADALTRAGLAPEVVLASTSPTAELNELAFVERSTVEQLTSIVLVAGKHGLSIPLDLVLRILGRQGATAVIDSIKEYDIIRWPPPDERGDQYLGTRTRLEAELMAQHDLHGEAAELEVIAAMVSNVKQDLTKGAGGAEVQLLYNLFTQVGPQSSEFIPRYVRHMAEILDAFKELHEAGNVHHRLVAIESNLIREYVKWASNNIHLAPEIRWGRLEHARDILEDALSTLSGGGRARLNLLVELASCLGAMAYELSEEPESSAEVGRLVERIVQTALEARAVDPESYYPVDVVAWVCLRMMRTNALNADARLDLIASAQASLDGIDVDQLSPKQAAMRSNRLREFGDELNDAALQAEHLEQLRQNGDPAAYFLLARHLAGIKGVEWDREGSVQALGMLRDAPSDVRADWRCARLLLDLFWLTKTGDRFLRGERVSLAFSLTDWRECLDVVDSIFDANVFDQYRLMFLRGLALFHRGAFGAFREVFEELDQATVGVSARVIATYLASNPDGTPRKFSGQVRFVSPDGRRGRVWIDELGIEIPFIPIRFSAEGYQRGDALPAFHIAFNMRGAVADPIRISTAQPAAS